MDGATVSVTSGNAINIEGGNPTIHVVGGNNSVTSRNGAGIYVAQNSTVTITGDGRDDVLTVTGNNGSSGIGGYVIDGYQSADSGNINIENVTLYAYSSSASNNETLSPGIGSTGNSTCQSITINNATVYAYGCGTTYFAAPAIGNGINGMGGRASEIPTVTISNNSEVHAHRGGDWVDYIGISAINFGSGRDGVEATVDASSTVYCYTGSSNRVENTVSDTM